MSREEPITSTCIAKPEYRLGTELASPFPLGGTPAAPPQSYTCSHSLQWFFPLIDGALANPLVEWRLEGDPTSSVIQLFHPGEKLPAVPLTPVSEQGKSREAAEERRKDRAARQDENI